MIIKNKIRKIRRSKGLTQRQLAAKVGVQVLTLRHHETHRRVIHEKYFPLYAKALGVEMKDVFSIG